MEMSQLKISLPTPSPPTARANSLGPSARGSRPAYGARGWWGLSRCYGGMQTPFFLGSEREGALVVRAPQGCYAKDAVCERRGGLSVSGLPSA